MKVLLEQLGADAKRKEHLVKKYVQEGVSEAVDRLPYEVQEVVRAAWALTELGMSGIFASWTAAQKLAEKAARENGLSEEKAKKLRATLFGADLVAAKPLMIAGEIGHLTAPLMAALSMVPPASVGWLLQNLPRHPINTFHAARKLIGEAAVELAKGTKELAEGAYKEATRPRPASRGALQVRPSLEPLGVRNREQKASRWILFNRARGTKGGAENPPPPTLLPGVSPLRKGDQAVSEGIVNDLADALDAHYYDDWYVALLCAALDEVGYVPDAVTLADTAYAKQPMDRTPPSAMDGPEEVEALFGHALAAMKKRR
jgi:hypothetical protein